MKENSFFYLIQITLSISTALSSIVSSNDLVYGYECRGNKCLRVELSKQNFDKAVSLAVCHIFCSESIGTLWPKPTGTVTIEPYMKHIDYNTIDFEFPISSKEQPIWQSNKKRFMDQLTSQIPNGDRLKSGGYNLKVIIENNSPFGERIPKLTLETDESYNLTIYKVDNNVLSKIAANSFFGARHGLETLSQLIVYDNIRREIQIVASAQITDSPIFKWRGLLLDTSRNFFSTKAIKRTLDAMAMVKLNTFHWHITDSHSFPFEVKSQSDLHKLGAYSPHKIYSHKDISDIVEYGLFRGIRVMPEFDAPAHVGEGWQHKNMTACFNAQPWKDYCVEPPCGQLDPTVEELYDVLEDIYYEMFDLFEPDVFHMGGDEVSINCWNSSQRIRDWMVLKQNWGLKESDFLRLWGYFQNAALNRVDKLSKNKKMPIILWTSRLTDVPYLDEYLDKDRYIIQIWTTGFDSKIRDILKRGFRVIISNYDALYFDCGGAGWVNDGNNWCSPYIGWQKVYMNNLGKIAEGYESLVLGAEAAVWSEQIDEFTLDSRFWPRASAIAERLWANPNESWRKAEQRLLIHRKRLIDNSIGAEAIQPEWCLHHENNCPIDAFNL